MTEKVHWAEQMARSSLVPDAYKRQPANLLFAVEYAETLGLSTMAAIQGIHVIKGKPSASAALMTALVRNAGHRVRSGYRAGKDGGWGVGWCEIVRKDDPDYTFTSEWTLEDAVRAELCTIRDGQPYSRSQKNEKQSWEKYPKAMLTWRAVTECVRQACEEVLYGAHYTPEEMGMEMTADGEAVIVEGELVRTDHDIAPKLVGDPDPPNWATELARAGDDHLALGHLLSQAVELAPNDAALHDRISSAVPWDRLLDTAAATGNPGEVMSVWRRARNMRPADTDLHQRIADVGAAVKAAASAKPAGEEPVDAEEVTPEPTARDRGAAAAKAIDMILAAVSLQDAQQIALTVRDSAAADVDVLGLVDPDLRDVLGLPPGMPCTLADLASTVANYWGNHGVSPSASPDAGEVAA